MKKIIILLTTLMPYFTSIAHAHKVSDILWVLSSCLIEIVNSVTGQSMFSGVLYDGLSVSTVGWTPGIYLVICKNGDNKETQKITVKWERGILFLLVL